MNPQLAALQPYPFEQLRALFADLKPSVGTNPIALSVGEPQHAPPPEVLQTLAANLNKVGNYPATRGLPELRQTIARWLTSRYALAGIDPESEILPVNGTREALFAFAQTVVGSGAGASGAAAPGAGPLVMSPNPFYQIYEGAALLAGASPHYLNCTEANGFIPDFESVSEAEWRRCQLLYLCSPGNPTGAVLPLAQLQRLIGLAQEYDFVIACDECYAEIYRDEGAPPPGLLQACSALGRNDFRNCVVFHSLSKRSNLPGLRSGFVAGDARVIEQFARYRTYHGCAMPLHHQLASITAWEDESHVVANRARYREKFAAVLARLDGHLEVSAPDAGFYLWPRTPISDLTLARELYKEERVTVLPGRFLARTARGINPGENHLRLALVAPLEQCVEAADRILCCLERLERQC